MKDLVVGEFNGNVRVYLNTNTDEDPVFLDYFKVQVGGSFFDCGYSSMPHVVDWDNDGRCDLLCGESSGKVSLLLNEGTASDPLFNSAVFIQDGMSNLVVGGGASPTVADLNRDGKKDLVVGSYDGYLHFFENKGTDEAPLFNGYLILEARNQPIDVGYSARMDRVDWDGDGVWDLISGDASGYVNLFIGLGPLRLSDNVIHAGTGGAVDFSLHAGSLHQHRNYLLLGSISGTEPGTLLPGGQSTLPVNWDLFTNLVINLLNSSVFQDFAGTLDQDGNGTARFETLGPVPGASGFVLSFAYALNAPWDYASNGAALEIVP